MGKTELFYGDDSVLASFGYFVGMIHFLCGAINSMPKIKTTHFSEIKPFLYRQQFVNYSRPESIMNTASENT